MLTNDADGNQILIERNMADLENDDSCNDVAQYVFQDGTGFALEDYAAIVEGHGDDVDEEACHGFENIPGAENIDNGASGVKS